MSEKLGAAGLLLRIATRDNGMLCARFLAMALISSVLIGALLLGQGIAQEATLAAGRLGADIMIVPKSAGISSGGKLIGGIPVSSTLPTGIEKQITAISGVSGVAPQYVFSSAADPCCEMGKMLLVGFDPSRDFTVRALLGPGDALPGNERQILAGGRVMKAPGAAMKFFSHTFILTARLNQSRFAPFDSALFISLEGLAAMERSSKSGNARLQIPWDNPSLLLLRVAAGFEPRQIAQLLEHQHPDIRVLSIDETARKEHLRLESLGSGCAPYSAITWLITILLGSTLLFSSFRARRSSIELLHCYGFGKGLLAIMFAMETFVLTLAGMVVGGGASLFALRICDQYLVIPSGVPLLSGWLSRSAVSILWSIPAFTGLLGVMAGLLVFYILRGELSGLVRNSR